MTIQLQGNNDSVFSNDIVAPNIPTVGSIAPFQEGLWIPEFYATTTDPTCGYSIQQGFYSRVGSLVTVIIRLNAGDPVNDGNRGAGSLGVNNLPYNVKPSPNEGVDPSRGTGAAYGASWSSVYPEVIMANSVQNALRLYESGSGSSISVSRLASGCSLYATCTYTTDDTTWTPINGATIS